MNSTTCEREDQAAAAVFKGTLDHETTLHARQCPVCSEIVLVSEFLHDYAALADREPTALPSAGHIWQKARLQAKRDALRRALCPVRYMKVIAVLAFVCAPWLRFLLPFGREIAASWPKALDSSLALLPSIWPVTANGAIILLGSSATILLLSLSSWYMLRQE